MTRREAVRNIALASSATIFMTGCTDRPVTGMLLDGRLDLDNRHRKYLARISETILPVEGISDRIGSPVDYILTMINDCRSPRDQQDFATGFDQFKMRTREASLRLKRAAPEEMLVVVEALLAEEPPQKELLHFIETVKELSVAHLRSSDYYLTEYREFEMIPAIYDPCRPVTNVRR